MKTRHTNLFVAASVVAALGVGALGGKAIALSDDPNAPAPIAVPAFEPMHRGFSELVKAVKPAVVNISTSGHMTGTQAPTLRFPVGSLCEEFVQLVFR
jgi:hypothetical protein